MNLTERPMQTKNTVLLVAKNLIVLSMSAQSVENGLVLWNAGKNILK